MGQTTTAMPTWVEEACARNVPAEIHWNAPGGALTVDKSRLLATKDGMLFVERPNRASSADISNAVGPLTIFVRIDTNRYRFESRVERTYAVVRLNDSAKISAIGLSPPERVREDQRREDYRVAVGGLACQVALHGADHEHLDRTRTGAPRFRAVLRDLSTSGAGIVMQMDDTWDLHCGRLYYGSFRLPGVSDEFDLLSEVKHYRLTSDGDRTIVGLSFHSSPVSDLRNLRPRLVKFISEEQRRRLRGGT